MAKSTSNSIMDGEESSGQSMSFPGPFHPFVQTLLSWDETGHTAPKGGQKSKFENAVFGFKPSYWMLKIKFEPKNVDISTFRPQKLTMSKRNFHLNV